MRVEKKSTEELALVVLSSGPDEVKLYSFKGVKISLVALGFFSYQETLVVNLDFLPSQVFDLAFVEVFPLF